MTDKNQPSSYMLWSSQQAAPSDRAELAECKRLLEHVKGCVGSGIPAHDALGLARDALTKRITDYLSGGGLFNPEMANHDAVRDLLIDCRDHLAALARPAPPRPDIDAMEERSDAWFAVVDALDDAMPGWRKLADTGLDSAVAAIAKLGGRPAPADAEAWEQPKFDENAGLREMAKHAHRALNAASVFIGTYAGDDVQGDESPEELAERCGRIACSLFSLLRGKEVDRYETAPFASAALASAGQADARDAGRAAWLRERFIGADFEWGDPPRQVLVFEWPGTTPVWGDFDLTLDAAIRAKEGS